MSIKKACEAYDLEITDTRGRANNCYTLKVDDGLKTIEVMAERGMYRLLGSGHSGRFDTAEAAIEAWFEQEVERLREKVDFRGERIEYHREKIDENKSEAEELKGKIRKVEEAKP